MCCVYTFTRPTSPTGVSQWTQVSLLSYVCFYSLSPGLLPCPGVSNYMTTSQVDNLSQSLEEKELTLYLLNGIRVALNEWFIVML